MRAVTSPESIADTRCGLTALGKVVSEPNDQCCVMQSKPDLVCPFCQEVPSHCIPEATEVMDIHSFV
jgi:hypothetical protein